MKAAQSFQFLVIAMLMHHLSMTLEAILKAGFLILLFFSTAILDWRLEDLPKIFQSWY